MNCRNYGITDLSFIYQKSKDETMLSVVRCLKNSLSRWLKKKNRRHRCKPYDLTTPKYPPLKGGYRGEVGQTTAKVVFFYDKSRKSKDKRLMSFVSCLLSQVRCPSKLERQFLLSHVARLLSKKHPKKASKRYQKSPFS